MTVLDDGTRSATRTRRVAGVDVMVGNLVELLKTLRTYRDAWLLRQLIR